MNPDAALAALADPTRRRAFELIRSEAMAVGEIASQLPVSRPAVSQHLRVLKDAGLVTERRDGARRLYSVDRSGLAEVRNYFERMWDDVLASYERAAEAASRARPAGREGR